MVNIKSRFAFYFFTPAIFVVFAFYLFVNLLVEQVLILKTHPLENSNNLMVAYTCIFALLTFSIMGILYYIFNKKIINRINNLNSTVSQIQKSDQLFERIPDSEQDEIGNLVKSMNNMLDKISKDQIEINRAARLNSLNQLASGVAHEVNNPLNIILGSSSLMSRKIDLITSGQALTVGQIFKELEDMKKFASKIKTTAIRIAHIVQSLRSLAKEDFFEESQETNPQEVVNMIMSLCDIRMKESEVALQIEYQTPDLLFMSRPLHLNKVMLLLISNCFDAVIQREEKWIKIRFEDAQDSIKILVSDSGGGVLPENQNKLFTPFFTTKPVGQATGLGLSVAKGLIESQNGKIYFDPHQIFTTFVIELPKMNVSTGNNTAAA